MSLSPGSTKTPNMPLHRDSEADAAPFLSHYHCAIVLGAQLGKLGKSASGTEVSLFLESVALAVVDRLERKGRHLLTVHTEDEFDTVSGLLEQGYTTGNIAGAFTWR